MNAIMKAAVITWLLDHRIKVVNVWEMSGGWSAMVETPPCGRRGSALTYPAEQKVGCGTGPTAIRALLAALEQVDGITIEFRLHLLAFMTEHLANRTMPALVRKLESGNSRT